MNVQEQIEAYITGQPEPKRSDLQALHRIILQTMPGCKLWFLDGKDSETRLFRIPTSDMGLAPYTMRMEQQESFIKLV